MEKVISAGGVFAKRKGEKLYLLLLEYRGFNDLGLLKGHMKKGETIEDTAIREVKEETGLADVSIVENLGSLTRRAKEKDGKASSKTIHMFLMTTKNFVHSKPEEKFCWYEFDGAVKKMAFKEEADFLLRNKKKLFSSATEN